VTFRSLTRQCYNPLLAGATTMPHAFHHALTGSGTRSSRAFSTLPVIKVAPTLARPGLFGD
jgi:hypothetical protein